jgi:CTD kinase subunit alpha
MKPVTPDLSSITPLPEGAQPTSAKKAGFKPIGQPNSAVKRFFPGSDDEDVNILGTAPAQLEVDIDGSTASPNMDNQSTIPSPKPPPAPISQDPHKEVLPTPAKFHNKLEPSSTPQMRSSDREPHEEHAPSSPLSSSRADLYKILGQVGEGTFGKVYKALNTVTRVSVALKCIRMETEKDGFPVTAMREIKLLQSLKHDNVVQLYEMMVSNGLSQIYIIVCSSS